MPEAAPDTGRFDDVLKIAVLRGGGLGDLLFAMPALDALAEAYPEAEIVLLGTPMHRELLRDRPGPVTRVEVLPRARGVHGPEHEDDPRATGVFMRRMRAEKFDLACQIHGGGRHSNPFLLALGARHTVGTATADAAPLERTLPYVYYQHEVLRHLETVALAGAPSVGPEPVIAVSAVERQRGRELTGAGPEPLVVIHPGATDPRRRWSPDRFLEIALRCVADGARVVLVGDGEDAALADGIARRAGRAAGDAVLSLAGRISLGELAGVLAVADLMVGNDSGPRHLAQAVGTRTASIFWVGNLINAGPLTRGRHRVQLSWTTRCPVCGRDATQVGWTAPRCEHDVSFVDEVTVDALYDDIRSLLEQEPGRPLRARRAPLRGT